MAKDLQQLLQAALAERYRIERTLRRGGMGTVFLAEDLKHGRYVALKALSPELTFPAGEQRFLQEIAIAANLQHPNILPLFDSGVADGVLYYVMPFVEGESLRDRLNRQPQLPIPDALRIARQAGEALSYAHDAGVLHRDIKPENILLSAGQAVVADFGLARALSAAGSRDVTQSGIGIGTPEYASPEQATGERSLGPTTDVYSLGCVLFEMLCGEPPFTGRSAQSIIARKAGEPAPRLRTIRDTITPQLEQVVLRALERSPADRQQSAADFLDDLDKATGQRPRIARGWLAAAAAVLLATAGALALWWPERTEGPMLAVLPFRVDSAVGSDAYAQDFAQRLVTLFSGLSGLRVIATTSSMQYPPGARPLREVGRELNADYLLSGSITVRPDVSDGPIVIMPELTRVRDGTVRWSDQWHLARGFEALLAAQSRLVRQIADTLGVSIQRREMAGIEERPTSNPEAWEAFRLGLALYRRSARAEDNLRAAEAFERATQFDSLFAEAYAAAAEAYAAAYQTHPDRAYLATAASHIERALELDQSIPEAHMASAVIHYVQGQYQQARLDLQHALEGRPSYHTALFLQAVIPRRLGRWDEAIQNFDRLVALDPRNRVSITALAHTLMRVRRYEEARRFFSQAIELNPLASDETYVHRAWLALVSGEGSRAVSDLLAEAGQLLGQSEVLSQLVQQHPSHLWFGIVDSGWDRLLTESSLASIRADSASFYMARAAVAARQGNPSRSRGLYDSAAVILEARLASQPDHAAWLGSLGVARAGAGRADAGIEAAKRGVALRPLAVDAYSGPESVMLLAHTYALAGDRRGARQQLLAVLQVPSLYSLDWVRAHPAWSGVVDDAFVREVSARR